MRTYMILKEKAARFNADAEIQALLAEINADSGEMQRLHRRLLVRESRRSEGGSLSTARRWRARGMGYERLDQLTIELLLGVR